MPSLLASRVVEHQAHVFGKFWRGSAFAYVLNPVLFLAALGLGVGGLVKQGHGTVDGVTYLAFVAPGLMAASAMQGAAGESLWPVMAGTKWVRTFHAMVATPVGPGDVYLGVVAWTAVRAAIGATFFLAIAAILGGVLSWWALLAIPAVVLTALAFAAPLAAFAATQDTDFRFPVIMRIGVVPLFLFSGTFFPISQLPSWLQPFCWLSPLWHGVQLCRGATTGTIDGPEAIANVAILVAIVVAGASWGIHTFTKKLGDMTTLFFHVIERNVFAYRRLWGVFLTGFAEPLLFLASIGIGVGALVGTVKGPGGQMVPYDQFVAPGLLAAAAMNGAVFDTTFNFFFKYKYARTFDAMLSTPLGPFDVALGELGWAMLRGTIYSGAFLFFMVILGLTSSPWAILCLPAAMLIGFAFAGAGMAGTTFMRSFVDFDYVNIILLPLFLFSGTFFPISQYPTGVQWIVRCTPLYQGVALERSLAFGDISWALAVHVVYLGALGLIGLRIASRRLGRLLQP